MKGSPAITATGTSLTKSGGQRGATGPRLLLPEGSCRELFPILHCELLQVSTNCMQLNLEVFAMTLYPTLPLSWRYLLLQSLPLEMPSSRLKNLMQRFQTRFVILPTIGIDESSCKCQVSSIYASGAWHQLHMCCHYSRSSESWNCLAPSNSGAQSEYYTMQPQACA
jgi:hypothetical protein